MVSAWTWDTHSTVDGMSVGWVVRVCMAEETAAEKEVVWAMNVDWVEEM